MMGFAYIRSEEDDYLANTARSASVRISSAI
jgi:hypothetical protein